MITLAIFLVTVKLLRQNDGIFVILLNIISKGARAKMRSSSLQQGTRAAEKSPKKKPTDDRHLRTLPL
jgi:hypothetical protein